MLGDFRAQRVQAQRQELRVHFALLGAQRLIALCVFGLPLQVRELRVLLPRKGQRTREVTIATTLLDPVKYPKEKILELYGIRWQVETHFRELKTTLKMRKLKSQTAQGVKKELVIYALVYNLVRRIMVLAAERQKVTPDRISFLDTIRWLIRATPGEPLPDLLINPRRPNRYEPRVVKDREDTYTKMTRPRPELRKWLMRQEVRSDSAK